MPHDFDDIIELKNSRLAKFDNAAQRTGADAPDTIPMWVADMDFRAAPAIRAALQAEIDRGVIGYFGNDAPARAAVADWMARRHGWSFDATAIFFANGVIHALAIALEAFTEPGDHIVVFSPVYHAFGIKIRAKNRVLHECPMPIRNGQYEMDFDALEASLTGREKMLIFCSPHNPGGRLWRADEIRDLAEFCNRHHLILISDEIHMDLTLGRGRHLNTAVTAPEVAPRLITLTAASKAFNIAGGETGIAIIEDKDLRARYARANSAHGGTPNRFGMAMLEAAFTRCDDWLDELNAYLAANLDLFAAGVNAIPGISVMPMDATYLAWVDFSGTGMAQSEFTDRVLKDARIAVNAGPTFGPGGETWARFNLATRRAVIEEAVARLQSAFADLQ